MVLLNAFPECIAQQYEFEHLRITVLVADYSSRKGVTCQSEDGLVRIVRLAMIEGLAVKYQQCITLVVDDIDDDEMS